MGRIIPAGVVRELDDEIPWRARTEIEASRGEQVHFASAFEICSWNPPKPKWMVRQLIPEKILCMIGGFAKTGKTSFTCQLIMDCLRGAPFLNLRTTKSRIAYFAVEETARTVRDRLIKMGLMGNDPLFTHCFPLILNGDVITEIITKCTRESIDTIIIDSMSAVLDLEDENRSSEMTRKMRLLLQLRNAGFTTIVIHHTGKSNSNDPLQSLRGSSAIAALVDEVLMLSPGKGNKRKLLVRGRYNSECIDEMLLDFQNGRYVRIESPIKNKEKDRATAILDFLKSHENQPVKQVIEGTKLPKDSVREILKQLVSENKVSEARSGKKGGGKVYNIK